MSENQMSEQKQKITSQICISSNFQKCLVLFLDTQEVKAFEYFPGGLVTTWSRR